GDAPPLFTVIAEDDRLLFKVVEGLYADWSNADRPTELHIFARGGHGFGMIRQGLPVDRWIDLYRDWLVDRGLGGRMRRPLIGPGKGGENLRLERAKGIEPSTFSLGS